MLEALFYAMLFLGGTYGKSNERWRSKYPTKWAKYD